MDSNFETALEIFGVGMVTIFLILGLVVISGQVLIRLVNRYAPVKSGSPPSPVSVSDAHIAAIHAAVEVVTKGKGTVTSIVSDK